MTRLELFRRLRNLSGRQLGMDLGISQPSMSRLENGHLPPDKLQPRLRQAMEGYFHRPVTELLEKVTENMVL